MPHFLNKLINYFYFTRVQRIGLSVLFVILIILLGIYFALPYFTSPPIRENPDFYKEVQKFLDAEKTDSVLPSYSPFPFDPNKISKEQLTEMGLSDRQANMIVKYREAGGRFNRKADFGKIYSISPAEYEIFEPYIIIEEPEPVGQKIFPEKKKLKPTPFNPNQIDSAGLAALGLRHDQVSQILKYRGAGGTFRVKQDFGKIYALSEEEYKILEKYILLPSSIDSSKVEVARAREQHVSASVKTMIEINSADTGELVKLYGIGPYYASKIIAYREKLGGFYDKSQLLEVFGIDTTRYLKFSDQVEVDVSNIKRMDLNHTDFNTMLGHPYLEFYIVKSIFNYKDAVGSFDSVAQLKNINLIYEQLYNKIEPYFAVNKEEAED